MTLTDEEAVRLAGYLRRIQPRGQMEADDIDGLYLKLRNGDPA